MIFQEITSDKSLSAKDLKAFNAKHPCAEMFKRGWKKV